MAGVKQTVVATSQVVERERCELVDFWLTAADGAITACDIYDGQNTTGKKILSPAAVASGSFHLNPKEPIVCENGLFIQLLTAFASCLVLSRRV